MEKSDYLGGDSKRDNQSDDLNTDVSYRKISSSL